MIAALRLIVCLPLVALLIACDEAGQAALGSLEWDRVNGRAIASETIVQLYVREGDEVVAGQPLLRLDSGLQDSQVKQSEARIAQLSWQLSELQAGFRSERIAAARAEHDAALSTLKNRETEFHRLMELKKENLTSQRNLDQARTSFDQAVGAEGAAQERLNEFERGVRLEKIAQAQASLEAEQAVLAYQRQLLQRYTVEAAREGVLESFPFKLGDKPPAGAVVTTVLSGTRPWARVYLPAPWLSQVQTGTEVDVFVDGRAAPMSGRIRHIESRASFTPYYALAEEDRQRLSYVTEVDLLDAAARDLPVGIPVQVRLKQQQ